MSVRAAVIVPAAGEGRRMGRVPKAFLDLAGRPVLEHTLRPFLRDARVMAVIVALDARAATDPPAWLRRLDARIVVVAGGAERADSVRAALDVVPSGAGVLLVHDAARPLVTDRLIGRAIDEAARGRSVVAAVRLTDTIHEVDAAGRITGTPERSALWLAQTPQAFPARVLREAHALASAAGIAATDDAAIVARFAGPVHVIEGERGNLKLTVPEDLIFAEAWLARR